MLPGVTRILALLAAWTLIAPPRPAVPAPIAPPAAADSSGFARFLQQQTDAAKAAEHKKDYDAAEKAWSALLELDPNSLAALEGLAESAQSRGDADAEVLARNDYDDALNRAIRAGDKNAEAALAKSAAR